MTINKAHKCLCKIVVFLSHFNFNLKMVTLCIKYGAMFLFSSLLLSSSTPFFWIRLLSVSSMFLAAPAFGSTAVELTEKYEEIEDDLLENVYDMPIYMESNNDENLIRGKVYGIIHQPFNTVSKALSSVSSLCEIAPLHLNIKACTYEYINNQCRVTFYSGRKFYQKADDVRDIKYTFKVKAINNDYFSVILTEEQHDSKDFNVQVAAIPLTDNSTFFYISYQYQYGFFMHAAMSTYLATFGYNKVGFSIIGKDKNSKPIYVDGIRGVIERNIVRYYFAVKSYLETQKVAKNEQFESRISYWFDLTEKYHKQLYEMDKPDYLKYKKLEYKDQLRLQKVINESPNVESKMRVLSNIDKTCISKD